jgi:uncharacterized UBP type Zn finger protein
VERRKDCSHTSGIGAVSPSSPDSCLSCVALGDSWVHLRVCLICGQVGCCDNSKNKHATRHFHETAHPIIQSYEPGELWRYCYVDDAFLSDGKPVRV